MLQEKQYHFFISLNPNTKHFQFPSEKLAKFILQTYFCVKISFILHFYWHGKYHTQRRNPQDSFRPDAAKTERTKAPGNAPHRVETPPEKYVKKLYPGTPIVRIAVPSWRECIVIVADNMPSISTSLSGNTSDNTLKMSISLIAKSGKPCGWCLPVPDSWPTNSMPEKSIPTYILSGFICVSLLFSLPFSLW